MIDPNVEGASRSFALLRLGFRPFFLCAAAFSCVSMVLWLWWYTSDAQTVTAGLSAQLWHAHEMIFGFALAVISGFLLTAVRNWTDRRTLHGVPLAALVLLWLGARLALLLSHELSLVSAMALDGAFGAVLIVSISRPIIQSAQWKQLGIVVIVTLIVLANMLFYWGAITATAKEMYRGMYLGLYLVTGLIIVIGGRVIPFFVERGIGHEVTLRRWPRLERANLIMFVLFLVAEVFTTFQSAAQLLAGALFITNACILWGWYYPGIWNKPLLWILYVAYAFIAFGFILKSITPWLPLAPYLAVHAFAYGGIGMMTMGMMTRVSLGHTGRNVHDPPLSLRFIFAVLAIGAIARVILPLIDTVHYPWWITLSQIAWIGAFALFLFVYSPILWQPRIDGRAE